MIKFSKVFLIIFSFQFYIEAYQLGQEKCSCSQNSFANIIQVDFGSNSMQVINLLDLDKDLNVSNHQKWNIELILRNKYFYKNLFGYSNRTFNYSVNPNIDLIKVLTLANSKFLNQSSQSVSSNIVWLKRLTKLSTSENDLLDIDPLWFNLKSNINQLNLSTNRL